MHLRLLGDALGDAPLPACPGGAAEARAAMGGGAGAAAAADVDTTDGAGDDKGTVDSSGLADAASDAPP